MTSIRRVGRSLVVAAAVLGLAWAGALHAQAEAQKSCAQIRSEVAALPPLRAVSSLSGDCLGGRLDPNPFTMRVNRAFQTTDRVDGQSRTKAIKDVTLSADEEKALILSVLRVADEYLGTVLAAASPADAPRVGKMRADAQRVIRERGEGLSGDSESRVLNPTYWTWDKQQPESGVAEIDIREMLAGAGCDAAPHAASCAASRETVEGLLRGANLVARSFLPGQAAAIRTAAARAATRDARWRSYFADARSQYPWEIAVNSWRYEKRVRRDQGLSGPPDWQWIVLHPDIGMQYVRDAERGDRFKPAMILELVGYNWWSWGGDNRPQNAWGASLVRTYADTASVPTSAWGVAVHRNNKYTLTLTRREGKTGVLLSIDLAGKVTAASQELKDRFRIGD